MYGYYRSRSYSCTDGYCGGCPRCGVDDDGDSVEDTTAESNYVTVYVVAKKDSGKYTKAGDIVQVRSYYTYDTDTHKVLSYHRTRFVVACGPNSDKHNAENYAKAMERYVLPCREARRKREAMKRATAA